MREHFSCSIVLHLIVYAHLSRAQLPRYEFKYLMYSTPIFKLINDLKKKTNFDCGIFICIPIILQKLNVYLM